MKRSLDLIRHILLVTEESAKSELTVLDYQTDAFNAEQIAYHILLLIDADFIKVIKVATLERKTPEYIVERLTGSGHDFLDSIRDNKIYKKILKRLSVVSGAFTLEIVKELGFTLLRSFLGL